MGAGEKNQTGLDGAPLSVPEHCYAGTTAVRPEFRFDEGALLRWLTAHVAGFQGPLTVEQFKGGQSNPTYQMHTPRKAYVLRRRPPGNLLPGAHDVEREARVLTALHRVQFPVPAVHALCADESILGTKFYVMEMIEGRVFWDATLPQVPDLERAAYFDAMNATIARLHQVDFEAIGLGDFGKPGNYLLRQIGRLTKQYLADTDAGRDTDMDALIEWLPAHVPRHQQTSIVHGDFRCDNLIFHPTKPIVVAVLDWELSTLGDPLADFAYHALMYRMPPDIVAGLGGADIKALRIPSESDYLAAYCERTGRESIADYNFYLAFNFFRMAAIFHGIKGRVLRGTAVSANAGARAQAFPRLAALARGAMQQCQ